MADETLSWQLKAEDKMSGPIDRINKALGLFDTQLEKTNTRIEKALGAGKAKLTAARADFAKAWGALMDTRMGKRASAMFDGVLGGAKGIGARLIAPLGKAWDAFMGSALVGKAKGVFGAIGGVMSGIGGKLAPVFGPLAGGFKNLLGAAGDFGSALIAKVGPALKSLGGFALSAVGALGALGAAAAAIGVSIVGAAGKWALSGLSFKEDTLAAFKTMLGTQTAAERVFKWGTKFAATTPFSTEDVVTNVQRLLTGGFKEKDLDTMMKAIGDVGANMGNAKMEQASTAIVQVKAKNKLQGEELMQLSEAGIGQTAVFEALARNLGISKTAAQARVSSGSVTGEQGVAAILEAIRVTQSNGKLGSAMEGKSKTLTGLMSSLEDIPKSLLFASDTSGVLDPIKKLVGGIIAAFDEGKPLFNRGIAMLERVSKAWGRTFGSLDGKKIEDVLGGVIDAIGEFGAKVAPFAEGFFPELMNQVSTLLTTLGGGSDTDSIQNTGKNVAQTLGLLAGGIIMLGKAIDSTFGWIIKGFGGLGDLAAMGFGGASAEATQGNLAITDPKALAAQRYLEERRARELAAVRGVRGAPLGAMTSGFDLTGANGGAAGASLTNVGNVAAVNVIVAPDDQEAGEKIANAARGSLIDQLKGFALEFGG